MRFQTASSSLHVSLTQNIVLSQSQVSQGNLPWPPPRWLEPSQACARDHCCLSGWPMHQGPQRSIPRGTARCKPSLPCLAEAPGAPATVRLCHGHPSPWAEEGVQSPDPAVEADMGLLAQGHASSSWLLCFTTSPAAKIRSFASAGCHLLESRELQ